MQSRGVHKIHGSSKWSNVVNKRAGTESVPLQNLGKWGTCAPPWSSGEGHGMVAMEALRMNVSEEARGW